MVSQIYPAELQLNKANTKAHFLHLHLSFSNYIICTKIYDKRDAFDFVIVSFPTDASYIQYNTFERYREISLRLV